MMYGMLPDYLSLMKARLGFGSKVQPEGMVPKENPYQMRGASLPAPSPMQPMGGSWKTGGMQPEGIVPHEQTMQPQQPQFGPQGVNGSTSKKYLWSRF